MRARISLVCAALFLPTAVRAGPLPANPSPEALEVARLIVATSTTLTGYGDEQSGIRLLERRLLRVGPGELPCARSDPACSDAARAVAREFGPELRRRAQMRRERLVAYRLDEQLRPEQIGRLATFFRSEEGGLFVEAWRALWRTPLSTERLNEMECRADQGLPDPTAEAVRRFRERTAHLPRTREPPPAGPPPASPPPLC